MWHNLNKGKVVWGNLSRVLSGTGVPPKTQGYFFKYVAGQKVLFGSKSWTEKPSIVDILTRYVVKVARRITGMHAFCRNGEWFWPSKTEALKLAGFHLVKHYIQCRRATIFPWVQQRPIYLACKQASMAQARAGSRGFRRWFQSMERPPMDVTDEMSQSSAANVRPARRLPPLPAAQWRCSLHHG